MSKNERAIMWAVVAAMVTTFGQELAAGRVPLPEELRWVIPVVVAGISALSPYLKLESK